MIRAESEIKLVRVNSGEQGYNTATIFLYKRSAESVTIDWTDDLVYNFANKALVSLPDGWSDSIPSGSNPLYVTSAVAYSNTATDTIPYTEWKTPAIMAEDGEAGEPGEPGEPGVSVTSVTRYYQLSSAQPELPDPPVSPPGGGWQDTEPPYQSGNTSLWYVDVSVFSDDSVQYSDVGRAYSYQVVSETKTLVERIDGNYVRWDAANQVLVNKENGEEIDAVARYLRAFMQFSQTTNYENPLLLLGDGTGVFTTAVSNKGMRFYQDTTLEEIKLDMEQSTSTKAIAYFDNNQMRINRGVVVDRLQVGKFRWDSQPNDNLMFRWIGDN